MKKLKSTVSKINPVMIADVIVEQSHRVPEKIALEFETCSYTFIELNTLINKAAGFLNELGLRKGERLAWVATNLDQFWLFFFAASKIGAVIAPLNWRLSSIEINKIVDDMRSPFFFVEPAFLTSLDTDTLSACKQVIRIDDALMQNVAEQNELSSDVVVDSQDAVLQLYTSGTTGLPKGVLLTHNCFHKVAESQFSVGAISPSYEGEVALHLLPHFHIAGVTLGLMAWKQSMTLRQHKSFEISKILEEVARGEPINTFLVPAMLDMVIEGATKQGTSLDSIACVSYGAAPMPQPLLIKALDSMKNASFYQFYGMTETTGGLSILGTKEHQKCSSKLGSAGQPLPNCDIKIVCPETHEELPTGAVGEIITRSEHLMSGYWNRNKETKEAFVGGFYKTGDAGFLDSDGYLFVVDRIKDLVISGGENIYPAELENILVKHDEVVECAFFGTPDSKWGEVLIGLVVVKPQSRLSEETVLDFLASKVAKFKLPRQIEFIDEIPRNSTGKVSKTDLKKHFSMRK